MKLLVLLSVLLLTTAACAQQPDRWRGLTIDEATPASAIQKLGKPDIDKTDSLRLFKFHERFAAAIADKKYRRLEYRSIEGFSNVILAFGNDRLVLIQLNPKELRANVLASAYGLKFTPTFDKFHNVLSTGIFDREGRKTGERFYPTFYYLVASAPSTIIVAGIGNGLQASLFETETVADNADFPGFVVFLQIVSRTLEDRDGVDILK